MISLRHYSKLSQALGTSYYGWLSQTIHSLCTVPMGVGLITHFMEEGSNKQTSNKLPIPMWKCSYLFENSDKNGWQRLTTTRINIIDTLSPELPFPWKL